MLNTTSILERLLKPSVGDIPTEYARILLEVDFSAADQSRYRELSEKSQSGALSDDERLELDDLLTANDVLIILHAKAKLSLQRSSAA